MRKTKITLLAIMLIISVLAFAQEKETKNEWIPKVSGFAQIRYDANFNKEFELKNNTFFLQRVCVNFDGKIIDKLTYRVGGDFVRQPALTDAYLKYTICDAFFVQAGQMKTPYTIENQFNPAFDCELFDYSIITKQFAGYEGGITGIGALGRDIGIQIGGKLIETENNKGDKFGIIEYRIGVFNGNGINNKDNDNSKDVIGRLDIHPWIKELTISGSYQNGMYINEVNPEKRGVNNRWSAGIQYKSERIVFRSEYMGGKTGRIDETDILHPVNKPFNSNGFYATLGYWFKLGKEGKQKLMPVVRYERLDKDETVDRGAVAYYTAGIYYLPIKYVNVKLNYQIAQPDKGFRAHTIVAMLNLRF